MILLTMRVICGILDINEKNKEEIYMCQFKIVPLEEQQYDVVIFSESYDSPFSCLEEITEEVKKNNIHDARVLFDSLLSSGNTSERDRKSVV